MDENNFELKDYWRSIILYGIQEATYKIALGRCIALFVEQDKTTISMAELAEEFFKLYLERLKSGKPQLRSPNRLTVMERTVKLYQLNILTFSQAVEKVEREAFNDVIHRFHNIPLFNLPVDFYKYDSKNIYLTNNAFELFANQEHSALLDELLSRWDLLEAAFEIQRGNLKLINDKRLFYLAKGYERKNVTHTRPVLNGYQQGVCFLCGEKMDEKDDIEVDHLIPRQFIYHDEIWNLVLSHRICNGLKKDSLPGKNYIKKLIERNEHFILSNHPIKNELIKQLGDTPEKRIRSVKQVYNDAEDVLKITWKGIQGCDPDSDSLFKSFIRQRNHLNFD